MAGLAELLTPTFGMRQGLAIDAVGVRRVGVTGIVGIAAIESKSQPQEPLVVMGVYVFKIEQLSHTCAYVLNSQRATSAVFVISI